MIGPLEKFVRASKLSKIVLRYFGKVWRNSKVCIIWFNWLIALYFFTLLPCNSIFSNRKKVVSGENSVMLCFSSETTSTDKCARTYFWWVRTWSPYLWSVHPPQLALFPSPTTLCMCSFLPDSPSTAAPFARYKIFNAFNARYTSSVILAEEGVPIFDSYIRFSPLVITIFVLAWRYTSVSSNFPQQLTSYSVTPHSSSKCHISLLWCGDCMLKFYWHLFYT